MTSLPADSTSATPPSTTAGATTDPDARAKVDDLLGKSPIAMLTTLEADGRLVSRPMATQAVEDGDLWFFASESSDKVSDLVQRPHVNVTVGSGSTWVSVSGSASVVTDVARKKELWNKVVEAWFTNGPEDADVVLLKVEGETAQYWDTPGGRVASLISLAKKTVTGKPYAGGDNQTVQL